MAFRRAARARTHVPKGRIRGNRARARQRSRYDLRDRYREGNVQIHNIGVLTIEDPYAEAGRIDSEGKSPARGPS